MANWKRWPILGLVGLTVLLILAACGRSDKSHQTYRLPNGDTREETASAHDLPGFLDNRPQQTLLAYRAAATLRDTLQWIPCYCGCGESAGHASNLDCFIHEVKEDGTVVWDDHGTRCDVCQQIALQSAQMKSEGKSDLDIRNHIDGLYRNGYASPTKTPMPQT